MSEVTGALSGGDAAPLREARLRLRWRLLGGIGLLSALVLLGSIAWWMLYGRTHVATDNAYVNGNLVQVTPQVSGTVVAVNADETRLVKQGEPLVELDPADFQVAQASAEAELGEAVRMVRGLYAGHRQAQAALAEREAAVASAQAELARSEAEVERTEAEHRRRQALAAQGFVSPENALTARTAATAAAASRRAAAAALAQSRAAVEVSRNQLAAATSLVDGVELAAHPRVRAAAGHLRGAVLALERTRLPAPVSGYVARRGVQVGQRVTPGTVLMNIVPVEQAWVDANFKESQIEDLRLGQPATLAADLYGSGVVFHGRVEGLGAGTGSAFALLPAQNATGNWIKIVQRLPVRIALDPAELAAHPLRVGLSMRVTVDTANRGGDVLDRKPGSGPRFSTPVYQHQDAAAEALIARIISQNLATTVR